MEPNPRNRQVRLIALSLVMVLLIFVVFIYFRAKNHQSQKSLLDNQQSQFSKTATADPILKFLPYGSIGYNINPTFKVTDGKRVLVIQVSVTLAGADYKLSQPELQSVISQREQLALDYIRSKGFDPAKYSIQYYVPGH